MVALNRHVPAVVGHVSAVDPGVGVDLAVVDYIQRHIPNRSALYVNAVLILCNA
jgi:hypothetical protein